MVPGLSGAAARARILGLVAGIPMARRGDELARLQHLQRFAEDRWRGILKGMDPTADQIHRLDRFLMGVRADLGAWPRTQQDWEPLAQLQREGVDIASACGKKIQVTAFHRLVKQVRKDGPVSERERIQAFVDLSHLTQGRALAPRFSTAWHALSASFSAMSSDPTFYGGLVDAFLLHRPAVGDLAHDGPEARATWRLMQFMCVCMDDPVRLERVLATGPADLCPFHSIEFGRQRMFEWLVRHHGPALRDNAPVVASLDGSPARGLADVIAGFSLKGMKTSVECWRRAQALDLAIGKAAPARGPGPRL